MDMSAAAIAPRQPQIREADRKHPLFALYAQHRSFCNAQMIECSRFEDFVHQHNEELRAKSFRADPLFPAFLSWMQASQGGARRCPAGDFPKNFLFWKAGGRW